MFVDNRQLKMLEKHGLSELNHYNAILNIYNGEKQANEKIQKILDFLSVKANIKDRIVVEGIFLSYTGVSFYANYLNETYQIVLAAKNLKRGGGSRGVLDYYVYMETTDKAVCSWDELFRKITGYGGQLISLPFICPMSLSTIIMAYPDSINNYRPTFINVSTDDDRAQTASGEMLTISGIKKFKVENIVDSDLDIITFISVKIEDNEPVLFRQPIEALEFLEKVVHE